ncbi:unnamed protein product [Amoebophrya sp. A120]|nr:unnamed protein product [Amoebophrya sp. A120]|eukprot:GSA120T00021615001.1
MVAFCLRCWPFLLLRLNQVVHGRATDPCGDLEVDPTSAGDNEVNGILENTSGTVVVTGGSGFIGSNLVELLLKRTNYKIRVLDNLETGNILYLDLISQPERLQFHFGDILDLPLLEKVFGVAEDDAARPGDDDAARPRPPPDIVGVFHLAAASKVLPSLIDPKMATFNVKNNALGTANLLEVVRKVILRQEEWRKKHTTDENHRSNQMDDNLYRFKKIVYAGSSTYYGRQSADDIGAFEENMLFSVSSPYAASKYMGELQMNTFDEIHQVPTVNLRFFMVYGPRNPRKGGYAVVTGIFAELKKAGTPLTIEGDGMQYRDFVHVEDVGRACLLALENPSVRGTSINIGSGRTHTILDAAEIVAPGETRRFLPARRNDLKGTLANTCKAKKELKFASAKQFEAEMDFLVQKILRNDNGDFVYENMDRTFQRWFATKSPADGAPPWSSSSLEEKNERVRERIVKQGLLKAALETTADAAEL